MFELVLSITETAYEFVLYEGTQAQCEAEKTLSQGLAAYTHFDTFIVREKAT